MPCVGERKNPNTMGNFAKDPMYKFAAAFCDTQNTIMKEATVDYAADPARATAFPQARQALKEFYLENENAVKFFNILKFYLEHLGIPLNYQNEQFARTNGINVNDQSRVSNNSH